VHFSDSAALACQRKATTREFAESLSWGTLSEAVSQQHSFHH